MTSQKRVRIAHDGRRIVFGFECGFTEAMVLNRVLESRIVSLEGQRLPRGLRYAGTGRLDLEAHLAQDDPIGALDKLVKLVKAADGEPEFARTRGTTVASILGTVEADGVEVICLDRLVHGIHESELDGWQVAGAVVTLPSRPIGPRQPMG